MSVENPLNVDEADPVETYSDTALAEYIARLRKARDDNAHVIQVSEAYVTKRYDEDELTDSRQAVSLALSLGVRVPPIRRIIRGAGYLECIQNRVQGATLMDAWPGIGWLSTIRLAYQLRQMIQRMRTATSPTAGSLRTGICRSFWLEDRYGIPVGASANVIASIVNFWHNLVSFRTEAGKSTAEHLASCERPIAPDCLVLTHHDLAPRNIMVDAAGNLWVVDWDEAGWYPRYFEYAGMHNFFAPETWGRFARLRWKLFTWFAAGSYWKEKRILVETRRKAIRFPAARRFNIKAGATPSTKSVDD